MRLENIQKTKEQLAQTTTKIAPNLLKQEAERLANIDNAKKELKDFQTANANLSKWLEKQKNEISWKPIKPAKLESTLGNEFEIRADKSILLKPKSGKDVYTVFADESLTGATAVRLELLSDPSLPAKGPGLAINGNLVLTEFEIEFSNPEQPEKWEKAKISSSLANITQGNF